MKESQLKGYCYPLSPEGKAQLIGGLPWHFSMDIMGFKFRTDPKEIKKLLPQPFKDSSEPDVAFVWFLDALSVWDDGGDMTYINPERTMYRECLMGVRCKLNGVEGNRCVYIWVDNDFTMLRGWFYGYPKKLGRIHMSSSKRILYEINRGLNKFGTGTRLQGFVEAHGERLITGNMKLGRQITPADLESPFGLPWFNILHYPSTDINNPKPLINQVIQTVAEPPLFGDMWVGDDATVLFSESAIEEHIAISPKEIISAHFISMGLTFKGTKVVYEY